jgi:hypothetical protein
MLLKQKTGTNAKLLSAAQSIATRRLQIINETGLL